MSNTDRIILRELGFFGHHGVLPVEAQNGQPFTATLELEIPLSPAGQHIDGISAQLH